MIHVYIGAVLHDLKAIKRPRPDEVHRVFSLGNRNFQHIVKLKKLFKEFRRSGINVIMVDFSDASKVTIKPYEQGRNFEYVLECYFKSDAVCSSCGQEKSLTEYPKRSKDKEYNGNNFHEVYQSRCSPCFSQYTYQNKLKHKLNNGDKGVTHCSCGQYFRNNKGKYQTCPQCRGAQRRRGKWQTINTK